MTSRETRWNAMLIRVRDFGEAHQDHFPESSAGAEAVAALTLAVTEVRECAMSQMSGRGAAKAKARARTALRDYLNAIARTARAIAEQSRVLTLLFSARPLAGITSFSRRGVRLSPMSLLKDNASADTECPLTSSRN